MLNCQGAGFMLNCQGAGFMLNCQGAGFILTNIKSTLARMYGLGVTEAQRIILLIAGSMFFKSVNLNFTPKLCVLKQIDSHQL